MVDDGYAEVDTTYRKDSNKSWNGWHGEKLDLKKKNKQDDHAHIQHRMQRYRCYMLQI